MASFRPASPCSKTGLALAAAACTLLLSSGQTQAQTWTPGSNNWNLNTNWTPNNIPDVPGETALFGVAAITNPTVTLPIEINGITFNAGASAYTILNNGGITLVGAGIVNNGVALQTINNPDFITFDNSSTAGGATVTLNNTTALSGISFIGFSDAGTAVINNVAASMSFPGAFVGFSNNSSASGATINNIGASSQTFFSDSSTAGGATIANTGSGSATEFFVSAGAGTATITNATAGTNITFNDNSSAEGSILNNNAGAFIDFFNSSTAGNSTINNVSPLGLVSFFDTASAGSATINNLGDGGFPSSTTAFFGTSTAANSTINNIGDGSYTFFSDSSNAGNAAIENSGTSSSVEFFVSSSAGGASITNTGDFTSIIFSGDASAGSSILSNDANDFSYIIFADNASAASATINNFNQDGIVSFFDFSNAGSATISNTSSGTSLAFSLVSFADDSSAGSSSIVNSGAFARTTFDNFATAGNATITNSGPVSSTVFYDSSNGGTAALVNANSTAFIDISQLTTTGTTAGSIAGNGALYLGSKNLTVGGNGMNSTFSGIIQDDTAAEVILLGGVGGGVGGSLTKVGLGTLTLTAANTYTGETTINGGALIINGSIVSPNTFVNPGALLGGMGVVGGNVVNRGVVQPGNLPAGLTVNGSYTQTSEGDLRIGIASNSTYGRLKVGGTANLDGSVTVVGSNGFKPKAGDSFKILTAAGGVNGEFDKLNTTLGANTILETVLDYESNAVIFEFLQGSFAALPGLTPNQKSVANALDSVASDRGARRLISYLNQQPLDQLPGDFDLIAPDELTAMYELAFSLATLQNLQLQRQTSRIRQGSSGFSADGLTLNGSGPGYSGSMNFSSGVAGPTGSEGTESKAVFTPTKENRWGVFVTGLGEWVDVGNTSNASGFELRSGGITLGLDYKVSPNFALGVTASYVGTDADLDNDGGIDVNGGKLGLYATYFTGGFYVDAAVGGGYNSYDINRRGLQGTANGDTNGGEFNALLGTGYDFKSGGWSFGPTANVQYTYVSVDEYTESGSLAPLRVSEQNADSLRTAIGFRASYDIKLRNGAIIRPEVRLAWQHEFGDQSFTLDSAFVAAGNTFSVSGPEIGRDSLLLSAGVAIQFNERVVLYLSYDGQLARQNYDSQSISGGVRVAF